MSNVILHLHCYGLWLVKKTQATFSTNGKCPKQNQSCFRGMRFPAFGASDMYLFRILIGSLCCLHLLLLARVITLVLVFTTLNWKLFYDQNKLQSTPFIIIAENIKYIYIYIYLSGFLRTCPQKLTTFWDFLGWWNMLVQNMTLIRAHHKKARSKNTTDLV